MASVAVLPLPLNPPNLPPLVPPSVRYSQSIETKLRRSLEVLNSVTSPPASGILITVGSEYGGPPSEAANRFWSSHLPDLFVSIAKYVDGFTLLSMAGINKVVRRAVNFVPHFYARQFIAEFPEECDEARFVLLAAAEMAGPHAARNGPPPLIVAPANPDGPTAMERLNARRRARAARRRGRRRTRLTDPVTGQLLTRSQKSFSTPRIHPEIAAAIVIDIELPTAAAAAAATSATAGPDIDRKADAGSRLPIGDEKTDGTRRDSGGGGSGGDDPTYTFRYVDANAVLKDGEEEVAMVDIPTASSPRFIPRETAPNTSTFATPAPSATAAVIPAGAATTAAAAAPASTPEYVFTPSTVPAIVVPLDDADPTLAPDSKTAAPAVPAASSSRSTASDPMPVPVPTLGASPPLTADEQKFAARMQALDRDLVAARRALHSLRQESALERLIRVAGPNSTVWGECEKAGFALLETFVYSYVKGGGDGRPEEDEDSDPDPDGGDDGTAESVGLSPKHRFGAGAGPNGSGDRRRHSSVTRRVRPLNRLTIPRPSAYVSWRILTPEERAREALTLSHTADIESVPKQLYRWAQRHRASLIRSRRYEWEDELKQIGRQKLAFVLHLADEIFAPLIIYGLLLMFQLFIFRGLINDPNFRGANSWKVLAPLIGLFTYGFLMLTLHAILTQYTGWPLPRSYGTVSNSLFRRLVGVSIKPNRPIRVRLAVMSYSVLIFLLFVILQMAGGISLPARFLFIPLYAGLLALFLHIRQWGCETGIPWAFVCTCVFTLVMCMDYDVRPIYVVLAFGSLDLILAVLVCNGCQDARQCSDCLMACVVFGMLTVSITFKVLLARHLLGIIDAWESVFFPLFLLDIFIGIPVLAATAVAWRKARFAWPVSPPPQPVDDNANSSPSPVAAGPPVIRVPDFRAAHTAAVQYFVERRAGMRRRNGVNVYLGPNESDSDDDDAAEVAAVTAIAF